MRDVDTSTTTEIRVSPTWFKVVAFTFGPPFLFFTWHFVKTVGRAMGFGRTLSDPVVSLVLFGGLALMFGLLAGMGLYGVLLGRRPVIFMSPEGYRDIRVSQRIIPWSEVKLITYMSGRHAHVRLALSRALTDEIFGKPSIWRAIKAMSWLGVTPAYNSGAVGLETTASSVAEIAKQYAAAHGGPKAK